MNGVRTLIIPPPRLGSARPPGLAFGAQDEAALAVQLAEAAAEERRRAEKRDGKPDSRILSDTSKRRPGESRAAILEACRDRPMSKAEMELDLNLAKSTITDLVCRMVRDGQLRRIPARGGPHPTCRYEAVT